MLGVTAYLVLTVPKLGLGCRDPDECLHDWQCGDRSICIPYEERYQCFSAPVCGTGDECDEDEACVLRSTRIVDEAPRDPFTSDAPGKKTCGGYAGPPEPVEEGCGSSTDDDGYGGYDNGTTSSSKSSSSSTGTTSQTGTGGGGGDLGGGGAGGEPGTGGTGGAGGSDGGGGGV